MILPDTAATQDFLDYLWLVTQPAQEAPQASPPVAQRSEATAPKKLPQKRKRSK
jgi:hypothetical protein